MKRNCPNCQKQKQHHDFQDNKNGEYIREFNVIPKTSETLFRCTVCGHEIKEATKKAKEVTETKEA